MGYLQLSPNRPVEAGNGSVLDGDLSTQDLCLLITSDVIVCIDSEI